MSWFRSSGFKLPRTQVGVSRWRRFRASIDWVLLATILAISGIGLLNLYSAVHGSPHAGKFHQQVRWMAIGVALFFAATFIDYRSVIRPAWLALGVSILALIVVDVLGHTVKHSERWIGIGSLGGQPSELAKLAVIVVLARLMQESSGGRPSWAALVPRIAALVVPVVLIALQPDLGTASLLTLIMLSVGFLALRDLWPMVYTQFVMLLSLPVLWETMHDYQKKRILCFLDPSADPKGACYHTHQSILAVGSGRVIGKGYMAGTQNHGDFLPEHWTDFPFSGWAEEWGFVGSFGLIALYVFLIVWILNVAINARDHAGACLCLGVAALTFWHVVVNIAMVLGVAPVVGVTLPFVSYGGSSVLTFFVSMGLVASVSLRRNGY